MSADIERILITNLIQSENWFDLNGAKFGVDGGPRKDLHNSGFMKIIGGSATTESIGGPAMKIVTTSVLSIVFFLNGGVNSSAAKLKGQAIIDAFFNQLLVSSGTNPVYLNFAATGLNPYLAEINDDEALVRVTVNCPFTRTESKSKKI